MCMATMVQLAVCEDSVAARRAKTHFLRHQEEYQKPGRGCACLMRSQTSPSSSLLGICRVQEGAAALSICVASVGLRLRLCGTGVTGGIGLCANCLGKIASAAPHPLLSFVHGPIEREQPEPHSQAMFLVCNPATCPNP